MSTSPTTRAAAAAATRDRLIEAAIDRFATDGVAASFDQVATDAGVTKGALYHHFASKDGLIEAVYRETIHRHAEQVIAASSIGDGRTRLFSLIDESARLYGSRTPFYTLLVRLHLEAGTSRPNLAEIAQRVQRRQRTYMIECVRTGQADGSITAAVDAEAVGLTVNAALQGFLVQRLESPETQLVWVAKFRSLMEGLLSP
ncbi:TetR/AcrR family transcriptional regulator [Paraconexibacter sp.]|uniref:TetR/AcrR family transcriptional regulator n=1 Tax=Paraconexibacter sp. TaxID=2949640 RepID=UPI0035673652